MRSWPGLVLIVLLSACAPREVLFPALGMSAPQLNELPSDFQRPLSNETGQPMPGFGGGGGGVERTPVIFVHGNTVSAGYWKPTRKRFRHHGYHEDEMWALSWGWNNARYLDAADLSVISIEGMVNAVTAYLEKTTGQAVPQVDIIAHSLGVTLVRQWMKQTNSWHRVRSFIGACGANDGVWTAWPDTRGQQRPVAWELYPGSPWLTQLSRGGEVPGPTRYMTLYDGTGWGDVLFPHPFEDSSALDGAYNLAYNREHGSWYGHLNLPWEDGPVDAMANWLRSAPDADIQAEAPDIALDGALLTTSQAGAALYCRDDGKYPDLATPPVQQLQLQSGTLHTCFARHPDTQLSSPIRRYKKHSEDARDAAPPSISANSKGGRFEHPQRVVLQTDNPDAYIVYNTSGTPLGTGSPLYEAPIFIAAPLTLTAMAIGPGGVRSEPLVLDFDISLELVEARHTLQRQFDPGVPVNDSGRRGKGN